MRGGGVTECRACGTPRVTRLPYTRRVTNDMTTRSGAGPNDFRVRGKLLQVECRIAYQETRGRYGRVSSRRRRPPRRASKGSAYSGGKKKNKKPSTNKIITRSTTGRRARARVPVFRSGRGRRSDVRRVGASSVIVSFSGRCGRGFRFFVFHVRRPRLREKNDISTRENVLAGVHYGILVGRRRGGVQNGPVTAFAANFPPTRADAPFSKRSVRRRGGRALTNRRHYGSSRYVFRRLTTTGTSTATRNKRQRKRRRRRQQYRCVTSLRNGSCAASWRLDVAAAGWVTRFTASNSRRRAPVHNTLVQRPPNIRRERGRPSIRLDTATTAIYCSTIAPFRDFSGKRSARRRRVLRPTYFSRIPYFATFSNNIRSPAPKYVYLTIACDLRRNIVWSE